MARYELVEGTSSKFWEISMSGATVTTRWGRIGTDGQEKQKRYASPAAARMEHDKLVAEKLRKGYSLVTGKGAKKPTTARAPAPTRSKTLAGSKKDGGIAGTWTRIEAWLAANAPQLAADLPGRATAKEIAACERTLGVSFPADLKQSLERHGGTSEWGGAPLIGGWQLIDLESIAREHALMKNLLPTLPDAKADKHPRITSTWWSPAFIPAVTSGSGHQICVDMSPPAGGKVGQVILFLHDDTRRFCVADSFGEWLAAIADGLESDRFGWDAKSQRFRDEAFLSVALEGKELYKPAAKKRTRASK